MWPEARPADLRSWEPIVDDLFQFTAERGGGRMIGVGHSLGAVVTLAAALRSPDLFRAVVLIDPVLVSRRLMLGMKITRQLGLLRKVHPLIPGTLRRRRLFASADEMFDRYRRAEVFKRIDDRGLRAYVDSMARPRPDGQVELAISPEWEAQIYEVGSLDLWSDLKDLKPPVLLIRGAETDTFMSGAAAKVKRSLPEAVIHDVPGTGHLVPLEKPAEVGRLIDDFLRTTLGLQEQT
jgi:pimeloyl-ACP methyl ester carboxylesterase